MDSLTHLVIGAVIGYQTAGGVPRKKAMLLGAVAQSLPDIDFLAALWLNPVNNLLAHRGYTHSIIFIVQASLLLALLMDRWHNKQRMGIRFWLLFFILQMGVHLFIDVMNVYGIGLLEPFDHTRFSLNILFVADPLFSLWPLVACISLLFCKDYGKRVWSLIGIGAPILYLLVASATKLSILSTCQEEFQRQRINPSRYMVTPTPLNSMLWYIIAENDQGYMIGYRSIYDRGAIDFVFFRRNEHLLDAVHQYEDLQHLRRFSQRYYIISRENKNIIFSDIRFGQSFGWINPNAKFVFRYYLQQPDTNRLVVQRGRFAGITQDNIIGTFRRITGK
jgi:inner membrane protein